MSLNLFRSPSSSFRNRIVLIGQACIRFVWFRIVAQKQLNRGHTLIVIPYASKITTSEMRPLKKFGSSETRLKKITIANSLV